MNIIKIFLGLASRLIRLLIKSLASRLAEGLRGKRGRVTMRTEGGKGGGDQCVVASRRVKIPTNYHVTNFES